MHHIRGVYIDMCYIILPFTYLLRHYGIYLLAYVMHVKARNVCKFLLVISSKLGPILYHFGDMVTSGPEVATFSTPSCLTPSI